MISAGTSNLTFDPDEIRGTQLPSCYKDFNASNDAPPCSSNPNALTTFNTAALSDSDTIASAMAKISFSASSSQSVSPAGVSEQSTINNSDDQKTLLVNSNVSLPSFASVKRGFFVYKSHNI